MKHSLNTKGVLDFFPVIVTDLSKSCFLRVYLFPRLTTNSYIVYHRSSYDIIFAWFCYCELIFMSSNHGYVSLSALSVTSVSLNGFLVEVRLY